MVIGFILTSGEAILVHRWLGGSRRFKKSVQKSVMDLEITYEEILDRKSTLESEKEAIQIPRSWVEDEARKSQEHAVVLEEARQRWRWDNQA